MKKNTRTRLGKETKQTKKIRKTEELNEELRINKFLSSVGFCSRRKADEYLIQGRVKVNGKVVEELGYKVKKSDFVTVDGDPVGYRQKPIYIILNKPKDSITTTNDDFGRNTVMDYVKLRTRVFPIGRLDRNTTGVLLLTNDGELSNRLTHPSYQVDRTYVVTLDKDLDMKDAKKIASGVELEDGKTGPADIIMYPKDKKKLVFTISEGKNREVRRIFEHFGYMVKKLDRKLFAGISNSGLKRGDYRYLKTKEILHLKKLVGL